MKIITEKLSIPQERPRLSRSRLIELLQRGMAAYSTTIISGRAGTGKTLLAADFARQCGRRVAWYRVDAADNDPRVFFQYLLESVRAQRPGFRFSLPETGPSLSEAEAQRLAEALAYALQESAPAPLLMVVEDLHLIYDEEWVAHFFGRLIALLPTDIHLLIVARSVPPTPLWRLRSKQALLVMDESWLAFTLDEARELFVSYGLDDQAALDPFMLCYGRAAMLDQIARQISDSSQDTGACTSVIRQYFSLPAA
ncbi:MAG TPA: AAA family ATPase [Blastocatellia bacterium]|nr:AAA family ATPase [Blastocatellia bacterium]